MKQGSSLDDLGRRPRPVILAAGFFDGVHRGHQAILRRLAGAARGAGAEA